MGARFGVGKGVVMLSQVVAAVGGNGLQLVVGEKLELASGGNAGAVKLIVGVITREALVVCIYSLC